jgi:hypothetical protein
MSIQRIIGMVLVVIGLIALLSGGITWTQRKTVVDTGPVEITTTEHKRLPLSPIVGIIVLVGVAAAVSATRLTSR